MDEVLEKLENTLITPEEKSNFEGLYKNWGKLGNQEDRRKEILLVQKSNRNDKLDRFRGILDLVNAVENNIFRSQKRVYYRPNIYVAGFNRASPTYSNVLMMSEWMIEKPEDLHDNWFVVPCPVGVRVLVVANQGTTRGYTKYGHFRFEKRTGLPGGHPGDAKNHCCVLDGFYSDKTNTLYILDLLAWNSQPMTDGETEFRHFWLQSQMAELPDLSIINKKNQMSIKVLPKEPCTPVSFEQFMMKHPMFDDEKTKLDGLLFYHKRAHYVSGQTPLVGWLYPFMVPEILGNGIKIHDVYELQKPEKYTNQLEFIQEFEKKLAKKDRRNRRDSSCAMDTADALSISTDSSTTNVSQVATDTDANSASANKDDITDANSASANKDDISDANSAGANKDDISDANSARENKDYISDANTASVNKDDITDENFQDAVDDVNVEST